VNKWVSRVAVMAAIGGGYYFLSNNIRQPKVVGVVAVPAFSEAGAQGEAVFQGTCAACHGVELTGTELGPPLIYPAYRPVFHSDYAITSAIKYGVVQHHWQFGSMRPQSDIAAGEIALLIAYIREMQAANGIN